MSPQSATNGVITGMGKLSWQFVAITSVALIAVSVAGMHSESAAIVVGAVTLIYGQVVGMTKTAAVQATVETVGQQAQAIADESHSEKIETAKQIAAKVKAEADRVAAKVVTEAASLAAKVAETADTNLAKIEEIRVATDGMKTELVKEVRKSSFAAGAKSETDKTATEIAGKVEDIKDTGEDTNRIVKEKL